MRNVYSSTCIYHPTPEAKQVFKEEIYKRFGSYSNFARLVEEQAEEVFNPSFKLDLGK